MFIFTLILAIIHWILLLRWTISRFCARLLSTFVRPPMFRRLPPYAVLEKRLTSLDKLPAHISLVIVEDDISLSDIARLVAWSMIAGITYVTIYDHRGRCKENRLLLLNKVVHERLKVNQQQKQQQQQQQQQWLNQNWTTFASSHDDRLTDASINLGCDCRKPCIFIVGPDDGRQGLVDVARQLSTAIATKQLKPDDMTVSYIDDIIQGSCGFPDPDLVLKFGPVDSILGFLPWQLRLSEIISLPSHRDIRLQQFIDAIVYFGNTEQRFGK